MKEFMEVIQGADHYLIGYDSGILVAKYAKRNTEICEEV